MTEVAHRSIDAAGRRCIAEFVHAAMGWAGTNAAKKFTETGRVSRGTLDRVKRGEDVSETLLRAVGDVLDLPRDYLLYIGYRDVERIRKLGEDSTDPDRQDLVRWTLDHLFPDEPEVLPRSTHTHSRHWG